MFKKVRYTEKQIEQGHKCECKLLFYFDAQIQYKTCLNSSLNIVMEHYLQMD